LASNKNKLLYTKRAYALTEIGLALLNRLINGTLWYFGVLLDMCSSF